MIKSITDPKHKAEWNKLATHPLQTWEWGEVKKASGNGVLRLAETDGKGRLLHVYLFTVHPLPFGRQIINYAKGEWPGPNVLNYLNENFGKNTVFCKLEPEVWLEEAGRYRLPIAQGRWQDNGLAYRLSKSPIFARHTFVVDLGQSEEAILFKMKSKTRYNLNLARRKGVNVVNETGNQKGFDIFFRLYQETISRQRYLGHNREYHLKVWEAMKSAGMAKIMVAYFQDKPLSAYTLFCFGDTVYYLYGGSSNKYKEVMASNLLMWESIRQAKQEGYRYFDMWGALEKNYDPAHPWSGFHRFKEGFGGRHRSYLPTIDLVFNSYEYAWFSFLWPIRTRILEYVRSFSRG